MTALSLRASRRGRSSGRAVGLASVLVFGWAVLWAGLGDGIVNGGGWSSFSEFWSSAVRPELSGEFLSLTVEAAIVTLSYAVLGTALSIVFGVIGAFWLSELVWPVGPVRSITRTLLLVPRAVHEVLWALLLIQILGFDPLVPVLAIGIPFGAVTAKVFAETIDEADPGPYRQLRATGARRLTALVYGSVPTIRAELLSYSFYRFECSIRSAAVLGVIGAGGLGFQLDLSFETLRYREIWTLIAALMVLSGLVEGWSSLIRRSMRTSGDGSPASPMVGRVSVGVGLVAIPLAWWWVGLDPSRLWSGRTGSLAADFIGDLLPPRLGLGGWSELVTASIDTIAMSILALAFAATLGLVFAALAARPVRATVHPTPLRRPVRILTGLVLLLFRSVPSPIWAFLMVLVLFPGLWPGAVALGVYTLGVLGRLFAEAFEDRDAAPATAIDLLGAGPVQSFFYGTLPAASNRLVSLGLYRWEVIARETVVVGVVGAGGLGQLINEHLAARDFAAVAGAIGGLVVISFAIDAASAGLRRRLRSA